MLTFQFTDVIGFMSESDELTSGMVGKQVQILVDESWQNLSRTYVFRAGGVCRTADGSEPIAVIPEAVLAQPFQKLYVGVYCTDAQGNLVIPTMMAEGPLIRYGANPAEDSTGIDLPVWKALQNQIGNLQELETRDKTSLVAAINELSGASLSEGLSPAAALLLISILRHAVYETDQSGEINALATLLGASNPGEVAPSLPSDPETPEDPDDPEITLSHISASYTGGSVPAGTALTALTGITVTAHYSDGTSEAVTGYTLSGTVAEGENTLTVTYADKTAVFTVIGEAQEAPEVTLSHITASYTGGSVPAGTALTALTGITVTAYYSDGTSEAVTGYTLSGAIIEGSNPITVSYGGKTATLTVIGTAASAGTATLVADYDFTVSLTDAVTGNEITTANCTRDSEGLHFTTANGYALPGIDCRGRTIEVEFGAVEKQGTAHGRCLTFSTGATIAAANGQGLVWHNNGQWAIYGMEVNAWSDKGITDANIIANSTITIPYKGAGVPVTILRNAETFLETQFDIQGCGYLVLGSTTTVFYNMTIKKLRIYEGV